MTSKTLNVDHFLELIELYKKKTEEEIVKVRADITAVQQDIETAMKYGDFSENSELHDATDRRAELEVKMARLSGARVDLQTSAQRKKYSGYISLSSIVRVEDIKTKKAHDFMIVTHDVAQFDLSLISHLSPIAKSLEGKKAGDDVIVRTPKKVMKYRVLEVI